MVNEAETAPLTNALPIDGRTTEGVGRLSARVTCPPKTGPGVKLDLGWMKGGEMPTKRHTPEQVINKLREAEVAMAQGSTVGEASRQIGVTEQTLRLRSGQALLPVA
jgi:hypothetical protein